MKNNLKKITNISSMMRTLGVMLFSMIIIFGAVNSALAVNNALSFDGTDDYVIILQAGTGVLGDNSSNESFTIEAMVNWQGGVTGGSFISKHQGPNNKGYVMEINTGTGTIGCAIGDNFNYYSVTGPVISTNQWYHVAMTYTALTKTIELFLDGISKGTTVISGTPTFDGTYNLNLAHSEHYGGFFKGMLDEVRIWNVVRTASQIQNSIMTDVTGQTGLVAYYNFNQTSGTALPDLAGGDNNGTLSSGMSGSEWTASGAPSPPGNALSFNGTSQYVNTTSPVTTATDNVTIEAWVKWGGSTGSTQLLVHNGSNSANGYGIWISNTSAIFILCGGINTMNSSANFIPNIWQHIAAVRRSGTWELYLDGVQISLTGNLSVNTPGTSMIIGGPGAGEYFNGQIDEVRIWDAARTQTEIQNNMHNTLVGNEGNLVAYYNFDQASGTSLPDLAGGDNNGTLVNSPTWTAATWNYGYPYITTGTASSTSPTTTTVSGTLVDPGVSSVTASGVCYATTANPTTPCTTGGFPASISGLTPGTAYYVRAYATNSYGTSYGEQVMIQPGNALSFNGANNYVQMNDVNLGTSDFTIEGWIKPNVLSGYIYSNRTGELGGAGNWFSVNCGAKLSLELADCSASYLPVQFNTTISANVWYHFAIVRNPTTITFYINGVEDKQVSDNSSLRNLTTGNNITRFGGNATQNAGWYNGQIDEFRIWNVARSQTDIQNNMLTTLAGNEAGLVAYYNFDESSGTVLPDITGYGHNGILVNGPSWVASGWPSPPTVTTSPISGITTTAATGGGDVSGAGVTARGVCYGTSASPTTPCTSDGTGGGVYTSPLASLAACTTYYVRAYATNVAGTSYGSDVTFKTKCLPVITPSPSVSATMSEGGSWVTPSISAADADGDALTWSLGSAPLHGTAAVSGSGASPTITYTPTAGYNGADSFGVTVSDVDGSAAITINVTINSANDPPSFTKGADQIADEDSGAKTVSGWATAISPGPADESAQILTFNVTNSNNALFSVQPAIDSTGTLTYTPAPDMNGSASVTVTLKDDGGGNDTSASETFTITINPINDPPVNAVLPAISGNAMIGATITADSGTWNDTKDTSLGGTSTITYSYQWQRADDLSGTNTADISGASSSSYVLTSSDKFIRVKVTATDTGVGTPATQSAVAYSAYSMAGNSAPTIAQTSPISVTMDEDGSPIAWAAPTVTATDVDNDTLTWSLKIPPENGTAVVSGSGASPTTFTYTPNTDCNCADSFVIQVSDGRGGFADMTINVTINPVNDLPVSDAGKAQTVYVGSKVVLDGSASKDPDGTIALYTWTQTAGTSVTLSDSKAIQPYFTAPTAPETLSFRLTVKDNTGEESSASVTITVVKADSPIAGFSANPLTGTVPLKVQFTDSSQGDISQWEWDFGDGTTSLEKNPLYQYSAAGTYTVKLTVTGPGGTNTYTASNYITVSSAALSVDFTGSPLIGVAPLTVYFHSIIQGSVTDMLWDFGDSQTSALPDPIHIYEKPGIYTVSLTVSDSAARSKRSSVNMTKAGYIVVSGRTISGTVTGEDTGQGLADFRIEVWKDGKIIGQATTDASGKYTVADIPALDNLIVSAWNPSSGLAKYYTQFYSGQRWPIDAASLSSISGDLSSIDFVMKRLPTTGIRGRVHDSVHGIAGVEVDIFSQKVNVAANAITDADGYYEVTGLELSDDYLASVHSAQLNTDFFYAIPEGEQVGGYVPTESVFTQDRATRITPADPLIENIDIIVKAESNNAIEGHVYSEDGKPLSGIDVNAWSDALNTGNGAKTDADGHYIIYGLIKVAAADVQTKGYVIEARSSDYVYQVYNKVSSTDNATLVATGAAGIDFYLKTGLSISGNVKDMNGNPASGVKITAWSDADIVQKQGTVYTDNTGNYTIPNLPPAPDYIVAAYADGYPVQYHKLTLDKTSAQYVSLDTENVQSIDFALDKGLVIRGAVYLGNTSTPAPQGITVHVQSASVASAADVQTDAQGRYEFVGLDPTVFDYVISIHYAGYVPAYYAAAGTASSRNDADRVAPTPVSAAADRNFVLITGYKISGSVTYNGTPISGIKLEAQLQSGGEWMSATTTAGYSDNYSITGLLPGVYDVVVSSDDYAEQKTTATITDKDVKLNIALTALTLRSISGTITGIGSGKTVSIIAWSATKDVRKTVFAEGTGSPVTYSISDLKPASDYVVEMSSSDYPYQVYKNKTRADEADWVDISKNNATGIDFAISSSLATISGNVIFPGDAVSGDTVRIEVFSRLKNISKGADLQFAGSTTVAYQIPGLVPASDYIVYVGSSKYLSFYYTGQDNGTQNEEDALKLDTTKSANITVNVTLSAGRSISGKIFDETGAGKSGAFVEVWSETTGTAGSATSGSDGSYTIKGLYSSPDFVAQVRDSVKGSFFYNDKASVRNRLFSTPVSTMQNSVSNINISILPTESISGRVTSPAGLPLALMWVEAWSELQQSGNGVFTDDNGNYQIAGLSKGSDYQVTARPDWFSLPVERLNISTGTTGLDFILDPDQGYVIKGVVKNNKGVPVPRVRVELWSKSLDMRGDMWSVTDNAGNYELRGLPSADDYKMMVWPRDDSPYSFSIVENISLPLPDDTKNLEIGPGITIGGQVRDNDGLPVSEVQVIALDPDGYFRKDVETDKDGKYVITNVPDSSAGGTTPTYQVTAMATRYIGQTRITKSAGDGIDFILEKMGKISGQVRDQKSGKGLAGITVEAYSVSMFGVKNFGGTAITDNDGYYIINGLKTKDLQNISLNDYQVTVNAAGYPPQSKGAKKVGEEVNFNLSRGSENEIAGTISDADGNVPSGVVFVAEVFEADGQFISSAAADSAGKFKFGTLFPEKQYYLKFTEFTGEQETASQWAAITSGEYETGIDNPSTDEVPDGAKLYHTDTTIHFRFGNLKKKDFGSVTVAAQKPEAVVNLHSISHVGSPPVNPKLRDNTTSNNIPVSNNPNITTTWEPPASESGLKYYTVYNTNSNFSINKTNAPDSPPSAPTQATSQKLQGNDVKVYCHVAAVNAQGKIGKTSSTTFRVDTVPPSNGTVKAPQISGNTVNLTLGASGPGVRNMYISNTGYGKNGEWETRVKDKDWKVSDGDGKKEIFVQFRDEAKNVANYYTTTQKSGAKPPEKPVTPPTPGATPVVDNQMFIVNITAPDGTVIGRIVVSASSPVTFVVISGNTGNVFTIDPNTGEIKVGNSKVLAQNGSKDYSLVVQILDGDKTTNAVITIKAVDPAKDKLVVTDQTFTVDKHAEDGTYIGTIEVFTTEASTTLSYHILSGNEDDIFAINTNTGDIIVWDSRKLSESTKDVYVLKVEVSDGKNTATAEITIKVKDFGSSVVVSDQNFSVNEDAATGTVIGSVKADSSDASATLSYRIISGNDDGVFAIDSSGKLTLIGPLNYDKAASYSLVVEVSDGRSTDSATIKISVNAVSKEILKGTWTWEKPDITGSSSAWFKNIAGIAPNDIFVVGGRFDYDASEYKNLIWRYSDRQWFEMQTNSSEWLYDIWGRSGSDIFAVGWEGIILHYDGAFWTGMSSPKDENLKAVHGDGSSVIAVGEKGTMLVYDGSDWKSVDTESSAALNGIWGKDGVFFIAAEGGIILRYDGRSITAENTGISENLYDIGGRSLSDIFAVGDKGTILHYDGKAWVIQRSGGTGKFSSISVSENHIFAAGDNGVVFHSSGRGWAQVPTGTQVNFRGIRTEGRSVFAVGDNGAILRFDIE